MQQMSKMQRFFENSKHGANLNNHGNRHATDAIIMLVYANI